MLWSQRKAFADRREDRERKRAGHSSSGLPAVEASATDLGLESKHRSVLVAFERKLDKMAANFSNGFFVKLNTRSVSADC